MSHIIGEVYEIGETQVLGEKQFKKRELILKTVEEYPQHIKIEFVQGNVDLLNNVQIGRNVKVSYNLRGRLYEKDDGSVECFNSVVGWKIEGV